MKLTALNLLFWKEHVTPEPIVLCGTNDVSEFSFFQRGGVREMLTFISRTLVRRTPPGERQSVVHEEYLCHCFLRPDGLGGIVVCDSDYPSRVAFSLLAKLLEDFNKKHAKAWPMCTSDMSIPYPELDASFREYQKPEKVDKIMKIKSDLAATKDVLHKTIDQVLERGVKLDHLVDKSADLSKQSKMFYKTAKKTNRCCVIQ